MSEEALHPDQVADQPGALDSEPSLVTDEDRLDADPLEDGMDTGEAWSRTMRLGGTAEAEEPETLNERLPQEVPDVGEGEVDAAPGRPVAATPATDLDESVDDPANSVDGTTAVGMEDPLSPDGAAESELMTSGEGEVQLQASTDPADVEATGDPAEDAFGQAVPVDNEWPTEGAEAQALHVEQES